MYYMLPSLPLDTTAAVVALVAIGCSAILTPGFFPALFFYLQRIYYELWVFAAQLPFLGVTDQGALLSWPAVQRQYALISTAYWPDRTSLMEYLPAGALVLHHKGAPVAVKSVGVPA